MGLALDYPVHRDIFPDAKINRRLQKLQLGRRGVDPCRLKNVEPLPAGRGGSDGNMEIRGHRTRRAWEPKRKLWKWKNLRGEKMKNSLRRNSVREVWSGMTKAADKREAGQVAGWTEDAETESGFSASTDIRMAHLWLDRVCHPLFHTHCPPLCLPRCEQRAPLDRSLSAALAEPPGVPDGIRQRRLQSLETSVCYRFSNPVFNLKARLWHLGHSYDHLVQNKIKPCTTPSSPLFSPF